MLHRDVRPGDCFVLGSIDAFDVCDDVYMVLEVSPVVDAPDFVYVTYAFLHELGQRGCFSGYTVSLDDIIDGKPLFDRR